MRHVISRIIERRYLLGEEEREFLVKTVRAYEDLLGVEVLTYCVMSNHFHLLVRVPRRPEGFDLPLETVVERLERATGAEAFALVRGQLEMWERAGMTQALEDWRQRQLARMFSLTAC